MFPKSVRIAIFTLMPIILAGCWWRSKPKPKPDGPTAGGAAKIETVSKADTIPDRAKDTGTESRDVAGLTVENRRLLSAMVFFDYESWELTPQSKELLEQKLAILNRFQKLTIAIDGHCDERGNDEFNLTLGRRRAVSVKQFFTDRGVNPERITTASFGRERPLVEGATEEAWARNRRAEFRIIDGDSM